MARRFFHPPESVAVDWSVAGKLPQTECRGRAATMVMGVQTFVDKDLCEHVLDRMRSVKGRFLRNVADAELSAHRSGALIRFFKPCHDLQQGRFAGAVRPDQSDMIALGQPDR